MEGHHAQEEFSSKRGLELRCLANDELCYRFHTTSKNCFLFTYLDSETSISPALTHPLHDTGYQRAATSSCRGRSTICLHLIKICTTWHNLHDGFSQSHAIATLAAYLYRGPDCRLSRYTGPFLWRCRWRFWKAQEIMAW